MDSFADTVRTLLLLQHDLETAEVVECPPLLDGGALLCEAGLLPLLNNSLGLNLLLENAGAGAETPAAAPAEGGNA